VSLVNRLTGSAPAWLVAAAITLVLAVVGIWGWNLMAGHEPSAGPAKKVYPGMYDLRAEAAKATDAQSASPSNGSAP
jgi:hypothetical protein